MFYSPAFTFSSVYSLGFGFLAGLRLGALRLFSVFLQAVRRLGGTLLFRGLRPSSSWGFPFWRLGLTVQSSRPAFGGRLSLFVSLRKTRIIQPMFYSPAFIFSSVYSLGFGFLAGLRLLMLRQFSAFFQALCRLRGALLFCGLRPSSIWGFPFWLLGLTRQSSRPAFGGRLTFFRYV